jgi:hypothetical protein
MSDATKQSDTSLLDLVNLAIRAWISLGPRWVKDEIYEQIDGTTAAR